ncbi:18275_t:CDS:2, partial [Acaulospora morrowiae]
FLQEIVKLLEPVEIVTKHLCGAKKNETVDSYLNLIYEENVEENDSNIFDDDISTAGTRQQWQYAHRQFNQRMNARSQEKKQIQQKSIKKRIRTENNIENTNNIEYLSPVNTIGLLEKVRAAIYFSLDELWLAPSDNALIATFLDPRFKHFNWAAKNKRDKAYQLVKTLHDIVKSNINIPDNIEEKSQEDNEDGDFFRDLEGDCMQIDTEEDDE